MVEIMGIKENFTQAVKELTGIGKAEEKGEASSSVEELKKAVDDGSVAREISLEPPSQIPLTLPASDMEPLDWEDTSATVRPMSKSGQATEQQPVQQPTQPDFTPAAENFFSGADVPVSLFGAQPGQAPRTEPTTQTPFAREVVQPQPVQAQPQPAQSAVPPAPSVQVPMQTVRPTQQTAIPPQPIQATPQMPMGPSPFQQSPFQQPYQQPQQPSNPFMGMSQMPMQGTRFGNQEQTAPGDNEITIISRNTVIDGNVRSFADMSIDGDIKGDVETTKNIDLNGKIIGNVTCNNAMMHTSQVQGNVRMKGNVSMKRDTLLIGDLMSTYADVNGKVKGNLDIVGKADFKGDSVVFGDISASTITVEDGAIIQGYVSTTFLNKEESKNLFPDTVVIGDVGSASRL